MNTVGSWKNIQSYLVYNSPSDSHTIKNSNINNGWHASIVYGLRTIRPHVWTFRQVNIAWTQTIGRIEEVKFNKKKRTNNNK